MTGLLAEFVAVTRQTDTTGVIGDSWLQRGRLQLAAETDMLQRTFTDTDHGLLSQVKWRDIGRSLHGPLSFHRLARARCEGGDLMRQTTCWKICSEASGGKRQGWRDSKGRDNEVRLYSVLA